MLRIYDRNSQTIAILFIDYALAKLPFAAERVQSDIQAVFVQETAR